MASITPDISIIAFDLGVDEKAAATIAEVTIQKLTEQVQSLSDHDRDYVLGRVAEMPEAFIVKTARAAEGMIR